MPIAPLRLLFFVAFILGAGAFGSPVARAQAIPPGSYQRSCEQVHWVGTTLVAECRRADGRKTGTGLPNANRCVGDIGNNNGQLQCNYAGGGQSPGASPPRGGPSPGPGYGSGPGYGGPGPGYGGGQGNGGYEDRRARCDELWRRQADLRDRIPYTGGPERDRLESRMHDIREERDRLGCR